MKLRLKKTSLLIFCLISVSALITLSQIFIPVAFFKNYVNPNLLISDGQTFNYGTIKTGGFQDKTFQLTNTSSSTIVMGIDGGTFTSAVYTFKGGSWPGTGGTCVNSLQTNATCTFVVTAFSALPGTYTDTITINFIGPNGILSTTRPVSAYFSNWVPTDLGAALTLWIDGADESKYLFQYNTTGTTGTGTNGSQTLTSAANVSAQIPVGVLLQIGTDTTNRYEVTAITTTTITVSPTLARNYTAETIFKSNVTGIYDKSGLARDCSQLTAASQPLYRKRFLNGLSSFQFENTGQLLNGLNGNFRSFFAVRNHTNNGGAIRTLFASPANTDFSIRSRSGGAATYGDATPFNVNDWPVGAAPSPALWINGTQGVNFTFNAAHVLSTYSNTLVSGTYSISSSFSTRGMTNGDSVNEIITTNTQVAVADRQKAEGYLAWKWGLVGSLPAAHPYKAAAP